MASSTDARHDRGRATRATDRRIVLRWTSRTPLARVSGRARDGTRQIRFISTVARLDVRHLNVGTDGPTDRRDERLTTTTVATTTTPM